MRKIREVLRLKFEVGLSARQVAISLQVGRASVRPLLSYGQGMARVQDDLNTTSPLTAREVSQVLDNPVASNFLPHA
jgi:DNA-binding transcriptional regulator LsrR (DeoR family)